MVEPSLASLSDAAAGAAARPTLPTQAVILQILPRLIGGGVEQGTIDIVRAITEAGGTALVASAGGPMVHQVERAGGRHITADLAGKMPWHVARASRQVQRIIAEHGVCLVHARSRGPAWSALSACRRLSVPLVTTVHAAHSLGKPPLSALKWRYNQVMTRGVRVIAISQFIAQHIHDVYAVPGERLRVIPRGIDLALFDPDAVTVARKLQLAEQWGIDPDRPILLVPGRLSGIKGQAAVIAALAALQRPELCAVFLGSEKPGGRMAQTLETQAAALGLAGQVRIPGPCRDMPAAYALASAVIAPSLVPEGFGRVPVEALAMGRPVIASDLGGFQETLARGRFGALVPAGDAPRLANALARVLAVDPADRAEQAAAGRAHVAAHYDLEQMKAATIAVYREVLDNGPDG